MISDDEVRQLFRKKLEVPGVFGGAGSLQIFRGKPLYLVDNMPPGGCARHKKIFSKFNVIPEYCFDCYKVLIMPHTVVELFKLLMVFEGLLLPNNNNRKCMVEGRPDCTGTYKGFVYCRGHEEGKEVHDLMQGMVADHVSSSIPVTLTRGCSEFSRAHPEFGKLQPDKAVMEYPKAWKMHEDFVDGVSIWPDRPVTVNAYIPSGARGAYPPAEIFAMQYWLRYAATIGDSSYLKISGRTLPSLPQLKRPSFVSVDL